MVNNPGLPNRVKRPAYVPVKNIQFSLKRSKRFSNDQSESSDNDRRPAVLQQLSYNKFKTPSNAINYRSLLDDMKLSMSGSRQYSSSGRSQHR